MSHAMLCLSHITDKFAKGFLAVLLTASVILALDCDQTIISKDGAEKNGTIHTPNYPAKYGNNLRCIFKFIAKDNERVKIKFLEFEVKGVPPRCIHDYVDVYTQLKNPDEDLLDSPLHGRYCGLDKDELPHLLISMGNIFIVGFYSDLQSVEKGFLASYEFIDAFYTIGTPAPRHVCGQTIQGGTLDRGTLLSPTYPGMYPDNVFCYYKILGLIGQRIKLTFLDLDLFNGGDHCPFDYVKVYDGPDNTAEVIGIYCGKEKKFVLFSTSNALHIEFVTKSGRVEPTKKPYVPYWEREEDTSIHRSGFKAEFEISDRFVNLNFIKNGHIHVRGTECDQRVLSMGETNGTITSPGWPRNYPLNTTCKYYIDGLVNKQNLEKATLSFEVFDIPTIRESCDNGYIKAFVKGQDIIKSPAADHTFCGQELPPTLITSNPRLLLIMDTHGQISGRGFKAHYHFTTDYAIPGTPATPGARCHFIYRSSSKLSGLFNSPRHPSDYPHNSECTYEFLGNSRQQVRITFENFKTDEQAAFSNCTTDYVEIFTVKPVKNRPGVTTDLLIGKYCGSLIPGPIVSDEDDHAVKVKFYSDTMLVHSGFRANYEFIEKLPYSKRCIKNITADVAGTIFSPKAVDAHKYGRNMTCEWFLHTKNPQATILLTFASFSMEGNLGISGLKSESPRKATSKGCGSAVLRIYTDTSAILPGYELCGNKAPEETIISQGNSLRLKSVESKRMTLYWRFISSSHAIGAKGFVIIWTEIIPQTADYCSGFKCAKSGYCISSNLKCNKYPNCGGKDESDEKDSNCGSTYSDYRVLHIILGVVITLIILVFIIVCILHRRRKVRKRKNKKEIEVRYVTRGSTPNRTGPGNASGAGDKLLKERTEKVSIV